MNDGHVPEVLNALPEKAKSSLVAFAFAPLFVKTLTIRCKVRPEAYPWLDQAAREVNQVWNFANATSYASINSYTRKTLPACRQTKRLGKTYEKAKWLSAFDLNSLIAGCGDTFQRIGIDVAQSVVSEFVRKRTQFKKAKLRFRKSSGSKKSLGWIPFKAVNIRQKGNSLTFCGKRVRLFNSEYYFNHRKVAVKICEGNFSQNALGEWFLNHVMEIAFLSLPSFTKENEEHYKVGMDPGKDISLSTGEKLVYSFYRDNEKKLTQLQKRGHKKQAKYLNNDIKNKRLNQQHQDTTRLIREHGEFYIGDNSIARMKKKKGVIQMGKSLSDNSIGQFKTLLKYKGHRANRKVVLVSERFTSQACSNCGSRSGPKGLRHLVVRKWHCQDCNTWHDRDTNAAINMICAQISTKNATFQPRNRLLFAETR